MSAKKKNKQTKQDKKKQTFDSASSAKGEAFSGCAALASVSLSEEIPSCKRQLIKLARPQTGGQTRGAACARWEGALSEREQLASEIQFSTPFLLLDQEMGG